MNDYSVRISFDDPRLPKRFWEKVIPEPNSGCWLWTGSIRKDGYGEIRPIRTKSDLAHRYVMWATGFPWLKDKPDICVCHKCDARCCVNPDHLFLGSRADNNADKVRKNRQSRLIGSRNPRAKLSELDVVEIRRLYATEKETYESISKLFGVGISAIFRIVSGAGWRSAEAARNV